MRSTLSNDAPVYQPLHRPFPNQGMLFAPPILPLLYNNYPYQQPYHMNAHIPGVQVHSIHVPRTDDDVKPYSVDVECAASGQTHNDRVVLRIGLTDEKLNNVFEAIVKPSVEVVSYLTELTGVTEEDMSNAISLEEALVQLKSVLPKNAYLVGHNIMSDIKWLGLQKGVDYEDHFNLSEYFAFPAGQKPYPLIFSLRHLAHHLLDRTDFQQGIHNPLEDAQVSMELFLKYRSFKPEDMIRLRAKLKNLPRLNNLVPNVIDGVCMKKGRHCTCGAP